MRATNDFNKQSTKNLSNTNRANRATQRPLQNRYYGDKPSQPYPKDSSNKIAPWYDSAIANYLYLFLFAPVGIWRMYANKRFSPLIKLMISCVSLTLFLILLIKLFVSDGLTSQTIAPTSSPIATYTPLVATGTPAITSTTEPSDDSSTATAATIFYIKGDGVRLRSAPTTDSEVIATLNKGDTITRVSISGDWSQVSTINKTGYIRSDLLSEEIP